MRGGEPEIGKYDSSIMFIMWFNIIPHVRKNHEISLDLGMNIGSVEINVSLIIGGESHASVQIGFIERVIKFDKDDVPCLGLSLPYFASCFPSSNVLSGHSWLGW